MKIFKGWFSYLIIAVVMVILATLTSSYYSLSGNKNPEKFNLLEKVPTYNFSFNFDFYKKLFSKNENSQKEEKLAVSNSTSEKLIESAKQAAGKIATEAPEKLANSGDENKLFTYISEKKSFFEKNGFYFTEGKDQKWDFGFWGAGKQIKLFSLKQ